MTTLKVLLTYSLYASLTLIFSRIATPSPNPSAIVRNSLIRGSSVFCFPRLIRSAPCTSERRRALPVPYKSLTFENM